jgi:hypothetical protein
MPPKNIRRSRRHTGASEFVNAEITRSPLTPSTHYSGGSKPPFLVLSTPAPFSLRRLSARLPICSQPRLRACAAVHTSCWFTRCSVYHRPCEPFGEQPPMCDLASTPASLASPPKTRFSFRRLALSRFQPTPDTSLHFAVTVFETATTPV